ncbi:MAG TPA: hypothetical protein VEP90_26600, partial [Methylomirabilota bacterium]|nr:hypothetical protein [Methylomirabilota bacterium]
GLSLYSNEIFDTLFQFVNVSPYPMTVINQVLYLPFEFLYHSIFTKRHYSSIDSLALTMFLSASVNAVVAKPNTKRQIYN